MQMSTASARIAAHRARSGAPVVFEVSAKRREGPVSVDGTTPASLHAISQRIMSPMTVPDKPRFLSHRFRTQPMRDRVVRKLESAAAQEETVKAMRGPSYLRVARTTRAGAVEVPYHSSATRHAERRPGHGEEALLRSLARWTAPVLSDEEIETYARLFLMKPGHELVPFFLWIDDAARAAADRRSASAYR
jgi:hypothetical protein